MTLKPNDQYENTTNMENDDYIEVFPDLKGTENLLNVTFAPGENPDLQLNATDGE